jgi:uncharacterized membrane protein YphA (DoxX/SURF4 family)
MNFVRKIAGFVLAVVLLYSAFTKVFSFQQVAPDFPALSRLHLPLLLNYLVVSIVIGAELILGVMALFASHSAAVGRYIYILISAFLIVSLLRLYEPINRTVFEHGCQCFGGADEPDSIRQVYRHLGAVAALWVAAWFNQRPSESLAT